MSAVASLLKVDSVTKRFRGLVAVDNVSLDVPAGCVFAVIGPNGAGKTTLFNLIAGVYRSDGGSITFDGARIDGLPPDQVCRRGLARTFQIVRPFPGLSVHENTAIGAMLRERDPSRAFTDAEEVLRRLDLWDKRAQKAASLTLPDRKRLEVARALATRPKLLLLDEVMAGLRPTETDRVVETLRALNREQGITIVMIEHVMRAVMALADRVHVLNYGASIAEGPPQEVTRDPRVISSYLGGEVLG
jgi:branched-chain amino acid transport system ATP-binding protein